MQLGPFVILLWNAEAAQAFGKVVAECLCREASPELLALLAKLQQVATHAETVASKLEQLGLSDTETNIPNP